MRVKELTEPMNLNGLTSGVSVGRAKTLEELREKEKEVLRDIMDGIRTDKNSLTINDLYYRWEQLKKGLKANTFQNYKYMYKQFVEPDFGNSRIVELKRTRCESIL